MDAIRLPVADGHLFVREGLICYRKGRAGVYKTFPKEGSPIKSLVEYKIVDVERALGFSPPPTYEELLKAIAMLTPPPPPAVKTSLGEEVEKVDMKEWVRKELEAGEKEELWMISPIGVISPYPRSTRDASSVYMAVLNEKIFDYNDSLLQLGSYQQIKHLRLDEKRLPNTVDLVLNEIRNDAANQLREKTAFRQVNHSSTRLQRLLQRLVRAYTFGTVPWKVELDMLALHQIIWQMKRKLNNMEVTDHICLLFFGDQGCGKSTAVRKLFEVFPSPYIAHADLDSLADRGVRSTIMASPITIMEEAHLDKAKMETLKQFITEDNRTLRDVFATKARQAPNRTTVVGTTNIHLRNLFNDPTGARRFWSIDTPPGQKMDWSVVRGDYSEELFHLVDESIDTSVIARNPELGSRFAQAQADYCRGSPVEDMINKILELRAKPPLERDKELSRAGVWARMKVFFDLGLHRKIDLPHEWEDDWDADKQTLWDLYAGQVGQRHAGWHTAMKARTMAPDYLSFQKEVRQILQRKFGKRRLIRGLGDNDILDF